MTTPRRPQSGDIQLEAPLARHADVVPAVEDRSYIVYVAGALVMALGGGFLLAVLLPLASSGAIGLGETGIPRLTQAHGWAQLQGWTGIFVAGMALRLMPRFAGRKPVPVRITLPVFLLLFVGAAGRGLAQSLPAGQAAKALFLVACLLAAVGTATVGMVVAWTLARGRKRPEPWRYFAWAASCWWMAWGVLLLVAGFRGTANGGLVPVRFDDAMTWAVLFGAIANFIWAVQSRSVPVFFGRKLPKLRAIAIPAVLLNTGALLAVASGFAGAGAVSQRLLGGGLLLAGVALAWLAPVAGSLYGQAKRLRPRARAAARYVLAANWGAAVAGVFLFWAGGHSLLTGEYESFALRDAARHAIGLGMVTMLIVGMAQLVSPIFALERAEVRPAGIEDHAAWWLLLAALVLRVAAALLSGHTGNDARMHIAAVAGLLAWLGLAMFGFAVFRVLRKEPRMKALLAAAAGIAPEP